MNAKTSRRRLLQGLTGGLAGAALAHPFLRSIPSAHAAEHPLRVVFFYSPNNSMDEAHWRPDGDGDEFALPASLPEMLSPLEPFRDKLLVVGNMSMKTRSKETGSGGHVGNGHQLTGWANIPDFPQDNESDYWAGGISLDQYIANELGTPAVTLAARPYGGANGGTRISYSAANIRVDPTENPAEAFKELFGKGLPPDQQLVYGKRQVRAMDRIALELDRLKSRLPQEDRSKLEIHLAHLQKLENDIASFKPAECNATPLEGGYDYQSGEDYPTTARRHMDVLAMAIACGVTRVGSIQNGNTGNAENYSAKTEWPSENLYFDASQHVIAHNYEEGKPNSERPRLDLEKFYVSQYAYLVDKLASIPEGDGSVLDNTLVVWTKGMGAGHSPDHLLYLLAGGSGFADLGPGRFLDRTGRPHNEMLMRIAHLVGLPIDTFGDPDFCGGGPVPL